MRRRLLLLIFIPFLLLGGLVWLVSQEWTLQWIVQKVVQAGGGEIEIQGVSGTLVNSFEIEKISYTSEERDIEMTDLRFVWRPLQLLQGHLDVGVISASKLAVDLKKSSDEPFKLPQSLAPPVSIMVSEARFDSVSVSGMGAGVELKDVHFTLTSDKDVWELKNLGFDSPFGNAVINVDLETAKPFKIRGSLQFDNELAKATASLKLGGDLDNLYVSGDLDGYEAKAKLEAVVTPFAPFVFQSAHLSAKNIDPSRIESSWPQARFNAEIHINAQEDRTLEGTISVDNAKPGPFDMNYLPVHSVRARIGGNIENILVNNILLDMGRAGQFAGNGHFSAEKTELTLKTSRFDFHEIYSGIRSTHVAGKIVFVDEGRKQQFLVQLEEAKIRLRARVLKVADLMTLEEILLKADQSEMRMSGKLDLKEPQDFDLKGKIDRFNFAAFGRFPQSDLNLDFGATGHLKQQPDIEVHYSFLPSRLFNQPLSGKGSFRIKDKEVRHADISMALGVNSIHASGNLGRVGDRLSWKLNAPDLAVFGKGYKGGIRGEGEISGILNSLRASMTLEGNDVLLMDQYGVRKIQAKIRFGMEPNDRIDANVRLDDAWIGAGKWMYIQGNVSGTLRSHVIELTAKNDSFDLMAKASGGLGKNNVWQGRLETLENRGKMAFALDSSVPVTMGDGGFSLKNLVLRLPNGQLAVQTLVKRGSLIETSGSARGIPLAYLLALSPDSKNTVRSDLTLGADWSLKADRTLNGKIHIYRENGDVTLLGDSRIKLGLDTLDMQMLLSGNSVNLNAQIISDKAGTIQAKAMTRLAKQNGNWSVSGQSPLQLSVQADIPSIAWIGPLTGQPDMEFKGSLNMSVSANGTLGNPRLSGNLNGKDLAVTWLSMGVNLSRGELMAVLNGDQVQIQKGIIYGPEGSLQLTGGVQLKNGQIGTNLQFRTDRLLILSNVDRQLAITGQGQFSLDKDRLQLTGDWYVNRATIVLTDSNNVTYSKDVVVLGRPEKKSDKPVPLRFNLKVNLGDRFYLKGKGINTRLAGQIQAVSAQDNRLRVFGTINTVDGSYSAFGQKLTIKQGQIMFSGPVENPTLDIMAVREVSDTDDSVEVGVSVKGTAQAPRVKLVSTPEVSDTEKLSWLVLGYGGGENGDGQQRAAIAAAAAAILSSEQSGGLPSKIASTIGLDDIGFSSSPDLEETVLTLSKRISSRLYLTYEQGLTGATNLIKLRYIISRRLSLVGQTGTVTAVDLLYDFKFD